MNDGTAQPAKTCGMPPNSAEAAAPTASASVLGVSASPTSDCGQENTMTMRQGQSKHHEETTKATGMLRLRSFVC
jgi:hypothetical protein